MIKKIFLAAVGVALATVSLSSKANLLTNGNFTGSTAEVGQPGQTYCYEPVGFDFYTKTVGTVFYECTSAISGWSGYFAEISSTSIPWGAPSTISGWQSNFGAEVVGLQEITQTGTEKSSSSIFQSVEISGAESLTLTWDDTMRRYSGSGGNSAGYELLFNGIDIGDFTVLASDPWASKSITFNAPGTGVLEFRSTDIQTGLSNSDVTAFIANVSLVQNVPEPASIFLFGAALAGVVFTRRKRQA